MTSLPNPTSTRPAMRGVGFADRLLLAVLALWRARAHRREVADLLRLDDRMLKDIGLVRGDVLGALAEPATADPSIPLRLRSVENRLRQNDRADQVDRLRRRVPGRQGEPGRGRKAA